MVGPRARRKVRMPSRKFTRKQRNPMAVSFAGVHKLVRDNWDHTKTLRQNYEALGLVASLNGVAGGTGNEAALQAEELRRRDELRNNVEWRVIEGEQDGEQPEGGSVGEDEAVAGDGKQAVGKAGKKHKKQAAKAKSAAAALDAGKDADLLAMQPVEPEIRIDERAKRIGARVNQRLVASEVAAAAGAAGSASAPASANPIIAAMEAESRATVQVVRHASEQEYLVYRELVRKHGEDFGAMARDIRLNKYQLSAGQLKRKIKQMRTADQLLGL
ncbi:Nucleolar protein 16 [Polyrhizophydium stewartii]|uniref:Nucleolar protein 16 n=1 Tax=Polyrhizophydium stewartii TaxID=2732419 RepID=A0ABR4N5A9_9FUNG|nr:Nucleolar protein 16 [Polyrhizophydium stewartii]